MAIMKKPSSKRMYNWYISLVAACCMILYGFDASVFNAVQGSDAWMEFNNNPGPNTIGGINTAYTVGGIVAGWFFAGPLSQATGRRIPMGIGCCFVIVATFMQIFSPRGNVGVFLGGRLLIGIGQGLALPIGPIYISELAPSDIRGRMLTLWQTNYSIGSFIAYWVNFAATKNITKLKKEWDWRIVVVFQLLAPLFIIGNLFFMPESPRWLVQKARADKARHELHRVRHTEEEVDDEMRSISAAVQYEKDHVSGSYKPLWVDKSVRKRLFLMFVINAGQQLTGQGSLNSYSTIVYKKVFDSNDTIQLINALNGTCGIIFTLNALFADRFGRKFLLIVGAAGMAVLMICAASVETQTPTQADGRKSQSVGIGIVICLFSFTFFYKPSWGAAIWMVTSEVFSQNVRAQAVGMSSQMQNVANAIVNQIFPLLLDKIGFYAFYMFAAIDVLLGLFVYFFIPETKGRTLEEMDIIFGGSDHVQQGMMEHPDLAEQGTRQSLDFKSPDGLDIEHIELSGKKSNA